MIGQTKVGSRRDSVRSAAPRFLAAMWFCLTASATTAIDAPQPAPDTDAPEPLLITGSDSAVGVGIREGLPLVRESLIVTVNVVGIARRNGAVETPAVADVPPTVFQRVHFEPREGFSVDDAGNIIVDDDPRRVSYMWYGQQGSHHLLLTVVRGQVRGMYHGPGRRLGISTEGSRTLLCALDADAVDAGGCASNRIADRPDFSAASQLSRQVEDGAMQPEVVSSPASKPASTGWSAAPVHRKHFTRIGVLFYYTAAAEQFRTDPNDPATALGVAGLQTIATNWIDQVNTTLRNSGDTYYLTFEQVGGITLHPSYTELTAQQQPDADLRFAGHLFFARDHDRFGPPGSRSSIGADFAVLMVEDSGNPSRRVWGAAYTQRNKCFGTECDVGDGVFPVAVGSYRDFAYAALTVNPTAQNLTFSHEMGHMLGANHDPNIEYPLSGLRGAYTHSYGYRVPGVARDVMADPQCVDDDGSGPGTSVTCTDRQWQFANPRATFIGSGLPAGAAGADVTRTITCLAEPSGNLYPITPRQVAPDIFWGGFEAPGLPVSTCGTRAVW